MRMKKPFKRGDLSALVFLSVFVIALLFVCFLTPTGEPMWTLHRDWKCTDAGDKTVCIHSLKP
jgi:hypothetical protein